MKKLRAALPGIVLLVAFAVFTVLVCTVGREPVPANNPDGLGFAKLNRAVNEFFTPNLTVYNITEILGYLTWCVVAFFGLLGLSQLIGRKSLLKVDSDILLLGGGYAVMLASYVLFEKVILNYRPEYPWHTGAPEASYPSSHTLMLVFVMVTAVMQIRRRMKAGALRTTAVIACLAVAAVVVIGRLVCGVHWFTDIIGGVLLASALSALYYGLAFGGASDEKKD